jgi:hypothetical protein
MTTKTFEIRDRGTFIPALAIRLDPVDDRDRWLLGRAGFGTTPEAQSTYVILHHLQSDQGTYDVFRHNPARTMRVAHQHIIENFDSLPNGAVIDVEYILGERETPKETEQLEILGL